MPKKDSAIGLAANPVRAVDPFRIRPFARWRSQLLPAVGVGILACGIFASVESVPAALPLLRATASLRFGALLFSIVLLTVFYLENRRSEMRYRHLLDTVPDAVVVVDRNGSIAYVNAQVESLFGYSRGEVFGKPIESLMPERYRAMHGDRRSGYMDDVRSRQMGPELEICGLRKDGREFPVEVSLSPIKLDRSIFVAAVIRDITERKTAETALKRSEERFRLLVQGVKDCAILMLDPNGLITNWNEGAERITGYAAGEIVGRHFSCFYTPEDNEIGKPEFELSDAAANGHHESEGWHIRKDGARYWANVSVSALHGSDGNVRGFSKLTRDFTERRELTNDLSRRNADLAAANSEMEAFTYSVAHDLRSPLRHIHGFSKILNEDYGSILPHEAREYLADILEGSKKMGLLIDDLLALARLSRQETRLQVTRLGAVLDEVIKDLQPEIVDREIEWRIGKLPCVLCDAGLTKQVYANLVSNAVKYSRPRKPAVIEIDQECIDGESVLFVRDNGVGFDMRYADKLFGVFQRLHRNEDFEGTGIGLAIVQRIVQKHGGRVWAAAEVEKGATFFFTLGDPVEANGHVHKTAEPTGDL